MKTKYFCKFAMDNQHKNDSTNGKFTADRKLTEDDVINAYGLVLTHGDTVSVDKTYNIKCAVCERKASVDKLDE